MFSIGFSLSKQAAVMVAEKCLLDAVALHPSASMSQQIIAYSVSNMVQRYTATWLKGQPKQEIIEIEIDIDIDIDIDIEYDSLSSYTSHKIYQLASDFIEKDLCQITCAFLGKNATVSAFSITFGTPTLIGYPVYLICKWSSEKIGSYIAQKGGQIILADKILHSVFKSTERYLFKQKPAQLEEIEFNTQSVYTPAYWKEQATPHFTLPLIINDYFKPTLIK